MWPGNTTDVTTLIPVVDKVRQRFGIGGFCIVADRGMISAETTAELAALYRVSEHTSGPQRCARS
ncbi:MAG: hypothetical protein Q8O92_09435 [Candidatus Latescibacter sp.]|nr:hypothetical protein [Candidatus Latescibacter sp.]